ncbi:hypothetical protein CO670_17370 [Rhizobium sp. J15]|uniref:hypothetical protein n=1 Tax=Rhizobium sp. J15 TaxID=2035450 RepID=UPI000BE9A6AA|nr:hypothetical protein [Rhizobium sp. J15]PDT15542.1 hypothetical protein CO670_17370 [Rhizobium sp. J15]
MEDEKPDKFAVAYGAQKLALTKVIQALVENASTSDPGIRDRIMASVEAYLATIEPKSELEQDFAERARASVAVLVRPPTS